MYEVQLHLHVACGSVCAAVSQQVRLDGRRGLRAAGGFGDGRVLRRTLRAEEGGQADGTRRRRQLEAVRRSLQLAVTHAAAFHLLGRQRAAGGHVLLLDRHAVELLHLGRRLKVHHVLRRSGTVALPLVQLHAQLLHLPLLLVQLPRQLLDHLLLLHQHFVLLRVESQTVVRRGLQAELRRGHGDVAEAVGQRAADGEVGRGRRDGWRGAAAAEGVEAGPVRRRGLIGRQRSGGRHGERGGADVSGAGRRSAAGVFKGPQSFDERRLGARHGQAADPQLLPQLGHL